MTLQLGSSGPLVKAWQQTMLARFRGYAKAADGGPLKADAYFGYDDQAVQREYEYRTGQPMDGVVSDADILALRLARFRIQGVGYNTAAFLSPDPQHSYVEMVNEGATEGMNLALPSREAKVIIGYSGGADTASEFLRRWPEERRSEIKMVVQFGDPSRPPGHNLLGNDQPGQGIAEKFAPKWVLDRYYSFNLPGDMYGCCNPKSLQPLFYRILTRAELTLNFAMFLFDVLTSEVGPILLGTKPSTQQGAGIFGSIAGILTDGPSSTIGKVLNPMQLLAVLPLIINSLVSLGKFVGSGDHGHYHDRPVFGGLTGVDRAVQLIDQKVEGGVVYLFPGTWAPWNAGYPFDVAIRLPGLAA